MSLNVVVSLMLLSLVAAANAQDWCNIQSCKRDGEVQTLCKFPNAGPSRSCLRGGNLGGGLSATEKANIVAKHNELRQRVARGNEARGLHNIPQPRAKSGRMPNLEWDDTLAVIAQRWADQCQWNHDPCPDVPAYHVGQNMALQWTSGDANRLNVIEMVEDWYNEVENFDAKEVHRFKGKRPIGSPKIGHYTQMVWAGTTKIGCGVRMYRENGNNYKLLVCNYGPSGNVEDRAVYET